ncbi:MAG TPA: amidohydrolase family protein [Chloroflexota bacterium]|jgi:imidazolonepropionase-like amidohydrolase|nr:amidohydrolase family protein [Chloroflexota bacterium]
MTESDQPLVLTGGAVVNVQSGEATSDCTVVIEGTHIARVERNGDFAAPPNARIVDTTGAWLIPGLTDMHVHLPFRSPQAGLLPLYLAHGVTTVRNVGGNLTELILLRREAAGNSRPIPRLFIAGPLLDGIPPLWPDHTLLVDTVARARTAVRMLVAQDVDCVKVYNNVPRDSLVAIVEEAHNSHKPVLGHVPRTLTTSDAIRIGMDCLEHIRITGRELLTAGEADAIDHLPLGTRETLLWDRFEVKSAGIERLIDLMVERQTYLDPTLIIDEDLFGGGVHDDTGAELHATLPGPIRDALERDRHLDPIGVPLELREQAPAGFIKRLEFIRRCNDAGVRLLAGTDTFGPAGLLPGVGLHNELRLLQRAGLSPLEALRTATITASEALGQDNLGRLEAGAAADMVVLNSNPMVDIKNVRDIRFVVARGMIHRPADLVASIQSSTDG